MVERASQVSEGLSDREDPEDQQDEMARMVRMVLVAREALEAHRVFVDQQADQGALSEDRLDPEDPRAQEGLREIVESEDPLVRKVRSDQ